MPKVVEWSHEVGTPSRCPVAPWRTQSARCGQAGQQCRAEKPAHGVRLFVIESVDPLQHRHVPLVLIDLMEELAELADFVRRNHG